MNTLFLKQFEPAEIKKALDQMAPLKSLGPDGFSAFSYQSYWYVVGYEISSTILSFLNNGHFDPRINQANIVMIPKIASPMYPKDFQPISLCNVIYKLIFKVLANRLKSILSSIISPSQSAFIPNRFIIDNFIVAYEIQHSMQTHIRGQMGSMAIKLYISKAHDWVEWIFLKGMMRALSFAERWIQLIMTCVMTTSYSVLLNDQEGPRFSFSCGICQGDPISPYPFSICVEGLSELLTAAEQANRIHGFKVAQGCSPISQLDLLSSYQY